MWNNNRRSFISVMINTTAVIYVLIRSQFYLYIDNENNHMMWGGEGGVCVSWKGEDDRYETAQDTSPWYTDFSWLAQQTSSQQL